MTEPEGTEESNTDEAINIITEIKHLSDRRNHINIKSKIDITKKEIIVDTGSPVTIISLYKETMEDRKR